MEAYHGELWKSAETATAVAARVSAEAKVAAATTTPACPPASASAAAATADQISWALHWMVYVEGPMSSLAPRWQYMKPLLLVLVQILLPPLLLLLFALKLRH